MTPIKHELAASPFDERTPDKDGVNHINIYFKSTTRLGHLLSHFAHTPFIHPFFGDFSSVEGFWYYIRSEPRQEKLRSQWGASAKILGKSCAFTYVPHFPKIILDINYHKCIQTAEIKELLIESTLPFDHYYTYGRIGALKQERIETLDWIRAGFEDIRTCIKTNSVWVSPNYQELYPNGF